MHTTDRQSNLRSLFAEFIESEEGGSTHRKTLERLRETITDPRLPAELEVLPPDSPYLKEAYSVYDALESVTNGMYNPEALSAISRIGENSPFYHWQRTIYAILSFYQGDRDNMLEFLDSIPDRVPPAHIKPVLLHLSGKKTLTNPTPAQHRLIEKIEEDTSYLVSAVEQLKEYLEEGMDEAFSETAALLIMDLSKSHPRSARRLAVTVIQIAEETSLSPLIDHILQIFGESEGNRLIALSFTKNSPDLSILFWIRLLLRHLREEDIAFEETEAHLEIIGDEALALVEELEIENSGGDSPQDNFTEASGLGDSKRGYCSDPDALLRKKYGEYFTKLSTLTRTLDDELSRHYTGYEATAEHEMYREEPLLRLSSFSPRKSEQKEAAQEEKRSVTVPLRNTEKRGGGGESSPALEENKRGEQNRSHLGRTADEKTPVQLELF